MKTHRQSFFILLVSLITIFGLTHCKDAKDTVVTKLLEAEAKKLNEQCPIQLDQVTRLDSCKVEGKMRFVTYVTVSFIDGAMFSLDDFTRMTKPSLVYAVQTNKGMEPVKKAGVVFVYSYRDESGKLFGNIEITPDDYNQEVNEENKELVSSMGEEDLALLLKSTAAGVQQALPMSIDEITTLQNCSFVSPKTLFYEYALSMKKSDVDSNFTSNMKKELIKGIRGDRDIMSMLDGGVIFSYKYNDQDGVEICTINITKDDF